MKKNSATFEQKRDCLVFMSRQEGDIPIRLEIITRNEYLCTPIARGQTKCNIKIKILMLDYSSYLLYTDAALS